MSNQEPADNINTPIALNTHASMHKHINLQPQTHTNIEVNVLSAPSAPEEPAIYRCQSQGVTRT